MPSQTIKQRLDQLHDTLEANYNALVEANHDDDKIRREMAVDVLAAVRRAASRVIEADFGEGIPQKIDLDELEGGFLDFVRRVARSAEEQDVSGDGADSVRRVGADLHRLLVVLCDYDGSAESDMRLVIAHSGVTRALARGD